MHNQNKLEIKIDFSQNQIEEIYKFFNQFRPKFKTSNSKKDYFWSEIHTEIVQALSNAKGIFMGQKYIKTYHRSFIFLNPKQLKAILNLFKKNNPKNETFNEIISRFEFYFKAYTTI